MPAATERALRFLTAGSVDDGKSTLIGRLLYDSRAILADQLSAIESRTAPAARSDGKPSLDLALLTDGLEAEREQGITIDVAWRYFATPKRKFVIADAPGHEQYTRNMVTAAAGSDAALVLVDITKLDTKTLPVVLLTQTRRHTLLARLLRVTSIVFVVNKIDAVKEPGHDFAAVRDALLAFAAEAGIAVAGVVPVSALRGDNVAERLVAPWYRGPSLLELLEGLPAGDEGAGNSVSKRFVLPVQYVARDAKGSNGGDSRRTLWGRIASGSIRTGDAIEVFPSGERARVIEVQVAGRGVESAGAGVSAGIVLDRQIDVSRGDWLAASAALAPTRRFAATLAWLDTEPAVIGRKYQVRHGNRWVQARIAAIESRLDIQTLRRVTADRLGVNEIGRVVIEAQEALPLEPFETSRIGGSLIVVDPASNRTSGALLVAAEAA
jgi:sulfate adenylyltransferase subunit 1